MALLTKEDKKHIRQLGLAIAILENEKLSLIADGRNLESVVETMYEVLSNWGKTVSKQYCACLCGIMIALNNKDRIRAMEGITELITGEE